MSSVRGYRYAYVVSCSTSCVPACGFALVVATSIDGDPAGHLSVGCQCRTGPQEFLALLAWAGVMQHTNGPSPCPV